MFRNIFSLATAIIICLYDPVRANEETPASEAPAPVVAVAAAQAARVQLALLLDTSNSMDGLITQAKDQLWDVVNTVSHLRRTGQKATLEVALYEYGNDGIPAGEQHLRQVLPFSSELDKISEKLFSLTTNGGSEYCGAVIKSALNDLAWDKDSSTLRLVFIAGNESFAQGQVDYATFCKQAGTAGILVNSIFCGDRQEGVDTFWQRGADLGRGEFFNIDKDLRCDIVTPFDAEIQRIGKEINETYIPYGHRGDEGKRCQQVQDYNYSSSGNNDANTKRQLSKSSSIYCNDDWDLVDAYLNKKVVITTVEVKLLPEAMRGMSSEERLRYVERMAERRGALKERLRVLERERAAWIKNQAATVEGQAQQRLGGAIEKAIITQAVLLGFTHEP
ncbi:MAG: hypothetical protein AB7F75_03430 [Planctomycetota bacterium]